MSEEVQTTVAEEQQTPTQSATTTEAPARFIDSLAEDIRNEPSLQNIQDVDQLAKGYVHAQYHYLTNTQLTMTGINSILDLVGQTHLKVMKYSTHRQRKGTNQQIFQDSKRRLLKQD